MRKKASLALSTNAIVVLIIAITILGLALAFTRNIFGTLSGQIENIGQQTLIDNPPTFDKPMTLSKQEFDIRRDKEVSLGIGFYNKFITTMQSRVRLYSCYVGDTQTQGTGNVANDQFTLTSPGRKVVMVNAPTSFSTSIKAKLTATQGVHACTMQVIAAPQTATGFAACNTDGSTAVCEYLYTDFLMTVE